MTETRERRITYDELRYILIACPTCTAEITIDLENADQAKFLASASAPVPLCPICGRPFNGAVAEAVHSFAKWARALRTADQSVAFRLREPQGASQGQAKAGADGPARLKPDARNARHRTKLSCTPSCDSLRGPRAMRPN